MNPVTGSNGFNILGMNIGRDQKDYTMLHDRVQVNLGETFNDILDEYKKQTAQIDAFSETIENQSEADESVLEELLEMKRERAPVEERLFYLLGQFNNANPPNFDPDDKVLADLLFKKGLDFVDFGLNHEAYQQLIARNIGDLSKQLGGSVKDRLGASQFCKLYPLLFTYLRTHYNSELPKFLKKSIWERVKAIFKTPPAITPVTVRGERVNNLNQCLSRIKQRLAESFFRRVITSSERPEVISLQEVFRENERVLSILDEGNYELFRGQTLDTAIALDKDRFQDLQRLDEYSNRDTVVYAIDRVTQEEFIFISTHLPGFQLEIPGGRLTEEELEDNRSKYARNLGYNFGDFNELMLNLKMAKEGYPNAKVLIQGDFNVFPEYFEDPQLEQRFKDLNIFDSVQNYNLELVRTNLPTEHYTPHWDQKYDDTDIVPLRELDYVVTDQSLHGRVKVLPIEDQELTLANLDLEAPGDVHFDPMLLFSDHRPIWMRVSSEGEKGESDSDTEEMTN